jgi:hypothetical protein
MTPERVINEVNALLEFTDFDFETERHDGKLLTIRLYIEDHTGRHYRRARTIELDL